MFPAMAGLDVRLYKFIIVKILYQLAIKSFNIFDSLCLPVYFLKTISKTGFGPKDIFEIASTCLFLIQILTFRKEFKFKACKFCNHEAYLSYVE